MRRRSWAATFGWLCWACSHPTPPSQVSHAAIPPAAPAEHADVDPRLANVPGAQASYFVDPTDGTRLYVLETGPARPPHPPLVLIHGVGDGGAEDYYPALQGLSSERRVIAVDLPGFGRTRYEGEDFTPGRLIRAVDAVVRERAPGPIDVLGHSTGGALALLFAASRNDVVRRLVVAGAAGVLRPEVLLRGQLHLRLEPLRENAPGAGKVVEQLGVIMIMAGRSMLSTASNLADTGLMGNGAGMRLATSLIDFNFGRAIAEIQAPTLIVWGEKDDVAPVRIGHLLDDRIAHSELVFVPDAGHVIMKDQPERFAQMVNRYLSEPVPRPAPVAPNTATSEAACSDQEAMSLSGDYARVVIERCRHVWLNRVRAREIVVRDSEARFDHVEATEGVSVENSELIVTGGELRGETALSVDDSKLDIAGVVLSGTGAAIRGKGRRKSRLILSVTPLDSPHAHGVIHEAFELEEGQQR